MLDVKGQRDALSTKDKNGRVLEVQRNNKLKIRMLRYMKGRAIPTTVKVP